MTVHFGVQWHESDDGREVFTTTSSHRGPAQGCGFLLRLRTLAGRKPARRQHQVYPALIEVLLLAELTGRSMTELCQWHVQGWTSDADLAAGLAREQQQARRANPQKPV